MRTAFHLLIAVLLGSLAASACHPNPSSDPSDGGATAPPEQTIHRLPISGPMAASDAEISGLDWHGDQLIFLPQYPRPHMNEHRGRVFTLSRSAIEAALADSNAPPLTPREIPVLAENLGTKTPQYEGCEAIVFCGDRAYLAVEATTDSTMRGYLVAGTFTADADTIRMDARTATRIPQPVHISNMSFESLLTVGDTLVALFEANGANVNDQPRAERFTLDLDPMLARSFPTIEYRITDATAADSAGRFWAINYFYPGDRDKLSPATDSLALRHGAGTTHRRSEAVERLVEFQYTPTGIRRTERPPIQLELMEDDARNWEGIARLGDRGFIIATDRFPETIVAFVPFSDEAPFYSRAAKSTTTGK